MNKDVMVSEQLGQILSQDPSLIEEAVKRLGLYKKAFKGEEDPMALARELHNSVDATVEHDLKVFRKNFPDQPTACKRGCSFCCYQNVDIFDAEAYVLAAAITMEAITYNKEEMKKQKNMSADDFRGNPHPCIFLENGECSIYEFRPITCRKYFVVGDPEGCRITPETAGNKVGIPPLLESELLYSAYGDLHPYKENASMPYMINALLEGRSI